MIPLPPPIPIPQINVPTLANVQVTLGNVPSVVSQALQPISKPEPFTTPTPLSIGGEVLPPIQNPTFDFLAYSAEIFDYLNNFLDYLSDIDDYLLQKERLLRKYAQDKEALISKTASKGIYYLPGETQYDLYRIQGVERVDLIELLYKALIQRIEKATEVGETLTTLYTEYYQSYLQSQISRMASQMSEVSLASELHMERVSFTVNMWADYIDQVVKDLDSFTDWQEVSADNEVLGAKMSIEETKASLLDIKKDFLLVSKSLLDSKSVFTQSLLPVLSAQISALVGEEKRSAAMVYEATARATHAAASATTSLWAAAKEKSDINSDKLSLFRDKIQIARELITAEKLAASAELMKSFAVYTQTKSQLEAASDTLSNIKEQMRVFIDKGKVLLEQYDVLIDRVLTRYKQRAIETNIENIERFGDAQEIARGRELQTLMEISDRLKKFLSELEAEEARDVADIRSAVMLALTNIETNMRLQTKITHTLGS